MSIQAVLGWLFMAGVLSGFVFQRSRLCFVSALRDLYLFQALRMTRAIVLLFLVTVAGGAAILSVRGVPGVQVVGPTPQGALLGGAIFAVGMVLAGSCAAGAFWRLGEGQLSQLFILLGLLIGTWVYARLPVLPLSVLQPTFSGWVAVVLLAVLLLALYGWERLQSHAGEELSAQPRRSRIREPWSPEVGALVMAVLLVGFIALTGQGWGVTRAFLLTDLPPAAYAAGLAGGGLLGAWFGQEWRVRAFGGRAPAITRLVGGILMGYGARVGWGCTVGAVMSGMVNLSVQPWYWMLGAMAGAALGAAILRRFMHLYL